MAMSEALEAAPASGKARTDVSALSVNNQTGYRAFKAGSFEFHRDEYFARLTWPGGSHILPIDVFLRAMMRDVAWGFFYGVVNFDSVFGTINHYGEVTMFAGRFNDAYVGAGRNYEERFASSALMNVFKDILSDWTNNG